MHPDDNIRNYGFLSAEAEASRLSRHPEAPPAFKELRDKVRAAIDTVHLAPTLSLKMNEDDRDGWWLGTAFWARTLEACQASQILADLGMPGSAIAVLRTGLECLFYACALWRQPSLRTNVEQTHDEERRKQLSGMRSQPVPGLSAELLSEIAALPAGEKAPKWSVYDAARAAQLEWLYETGYRGLGFTGAHATVVSADRYFVSHPTIGEVMDIGPQFNELEFILFGIAVCLDTGMAQFQEQAIAHAPQPTPE